MKAAIPLASVMRIPSLFIFTHDSIGLGEDGPTHQPIEQLAMLRAQPNVYVVRLAAGGAGACALRESFKGRDEVPDLILVGTGSEVHLCNQAAALLEANGTATT